MLVYKLKLKFYFIIFICRVSTRIVKMILIWSIYYV